MANLPEIKNYTLIREIGRGGCGVVFLAKNPKGDFVAVKVLKSEKLGQKEKQALRSYMEFLKGSKSANIIPVNAVFDEGGVFYYEMPLSDGATDVGCADESWRPKTLEHLIEQKLSSNSWFSVEEILSVFLPIVNAAAEIWRHKLVHRDIKPANILFLNGRACLADIGLLREDSAEPGLSGTLDYMPPKWYVESRGNQDLWGLAATFYRFITGNPLECISRAAYLYPENIRGRMGPAQINAWDHFHKCINRAMSENQLDRYLKIEAFGFDLLKCFTPEGADISENGGEPVPRLTKKNKQYLRRTTSIFTFSGRINRKTFIPLFVINSVFLSISSVCVFAAVEAGWPAIPLIAVVLIAVLAHWIYFATLSKRFHDANVSGLWSIAIYAINNMAALIAPLATILLLLIELAVLMALKPCDKFNKYALQSQKIRFF